MCKGLLNREVRRWLHYKNVKLTAVNGNRRAHFPLVPVSAMGVNSTAEMGRSELPTVMEKRVKTQLGSVWQWKTCRLPSVGVNANSLLKICSSVCICCLWNQDSLLDFHGILDHLIVLGLRRVGWTKDPRNPCLWWWMASRRHLGNRVRNSAGIGSSHVQIGNFLSWKQGISFVIRCNKIWHNRNECRIQRYNKPIVTELV